jgi:hypothetical protein
MELLQKNEFKNKDVVTTDLVAKEHGVTKGEINQSINRNRKWFIEGEDVFIIPRTQDNFKLYRELFGSNAQKEAFLLTENGYLNLVKIMDTPRSWEVYKNLKEVYFASRDKLKELQKRYNTLKASYMRREVAIQFLPMKEAIENNPSLSETAREWASQNYSKLISKGLTGFIPSVYKKHYKTHGLEWRDHIKKTFPELLESIKNTENYIATLQESELTYKEAKPIIEKYMANQIKKVQKQLSE